MAAARGAGTGDGDWTVVPAGPYRWRCDAARQVENFTDFGHFPWVHPGLLGDPERPVVPPHQVRTDGHVLRYEIVRPEAPNSEDFPVFGNEQAGPPERRSRYELHLPYTIVLRLGWGGRARHGVLLRLAAGRRGPLRGLRGDRPQLQPGPAGPGACRSSRTRSSARTRWSWSRSGPSGCRSTWPTSCTCKFDAVAVAYRKAMRDLGLAASAPIGISAE